MRAESSVNNGLFSMMLRSIVVHQVGDAGSGPMFPLGRSPKMGDAVCKASDAWVEISNGVAWQIVAWSLPSRMAKPGENARFHASNNIGDGVET